MTRRFAPVIAASLLARLSWADTSIDEDPHLISAAAVVSSPDPGSGVRFWPPEFPVEANRPDEALDAYRKGIEAAEKKGDKQAGKEMAVYARRLEKGRG